MALTETVYKLPVSTRRGQALVNTLGVVAILFLVGVAVTLVSGAPPEIEAWTGTMTIVGAGALAGSLGLHRLRRRYLRIVRSDDAHHLVIERERVRLEFPLGVSGDQMTNHMSGTYEVWLKLSNANRGAAVFLTETRGTIYGAQPDWLIGIDRAVPAKRFDVGGAGTLQKLRAVVERINARSPDQ